VDIYPEKAEQKKKEYNLACEVFASYKKLLSRMEKNPWRRRLGQ
jgi:hypothetical protein